MAFTNFAGRFFEENPIHKDGYASVKFTASSHIFTDETSENTLLNHDMEG